MQKYGFIYIWRDKKYNRYYVGSHWGTEDDGYICSSTWMRNSFNNRPDDFKRRIISKVFTDRDDLYEEEQKWLNLIKKEELGKRYYNFLLEVKPQFTNKDKKHKEETIQKIRESNLGQKRSAETKARVKAARAKQIFTQESQDKKSVSLFEDYANQTDEQKLKRISGALEWHQDPENKKRMSKLRSENNKRLQKEGKIGMKGRKHSEETKRKIRESNQKTAAMKKAK